jgi:hypothetical protein
MNTIDWPALQRAARAALDMGHYQVAAMLQAAATSLITRRLYADALPKTDAALAEALAALEPGLAAAGLDAGLLAALRHARVRVAEGGTVGYADAPVLHVCRVCGAVTRGPRPAACPQCGAGPLVLQLFRPTFYLEPEPAAVVLEYLAATPPWLAALVAGLSPAQCDLQVAGSEGEWSLRAGADHLLGAGQLLARRVELFYTHPAPDLAAQPPSAVLGEEPLPIPALVERFAAERAALLARLPAPGDALWSRVGQHGEFGPVTLLQQATYFAKHEQWHMAQMTRMRRALEKRV